MSTFRHPVWPDVTETVPDDRDEGMTFAGWVRVEDSPEPDEPVETQPPSRPARHRRGH